MTMRAGVSIIAVVAAIVLSPAANAADLTVGAFGGIWEQSLRKCIIEPFTKQTGKTVDVVLGSPTQWLNQIAASPGKPPLDIVYNPTETAYEAINRGLVIQFTPETVPNAQAVSQRFQQMTDGGWGSVHNYGAMGIIYNATTVKDPPKSFQDFVSGTVAGKWKASMPSVNYPSAGFTVSIWYFAKLFGGDVDNIQPGLDMVKKMQTSGNLSFWTDPNSVLNGLKSGDIDMALYWDGRAYAFIDDGNKDFKYYSPEPGVVVAFTWIQVVKNAAPAALQFANFALGKDPQSCFGSAIRYGIANKDAVIAPAVIDEITPANILVIPPYKQVVPKQGAWLEAWNKFIGR